MLWGVAELNAVENASGFLWFKCFVERSWAVRIEIVLYHGDQQYVAIVQVYQILEQMGIINRRSLRGDFDVPPPRPKAHTA
jgi:hypothetical protein